MPYANSGGVSIYYAVHGKQGSSLIMSHGLGCSIADWGPARNIRSSCLIIVERVSRTNQQMLSPWQSLLLTQ